MFLISFVSAAPVLSTEDSSSSAGGADYQPASTGAGGSASSGKPKCITSWQTLDKGKTWSKADLIEYKGEKKLIIDGNKCKVNQSLNKARLNYARFSSFHLF